MSRDRDSPDNVHRCHWPECRRAIAPKLWGCRQHWFALPKEIRDRIWRAYRPGQEVTKDPSPAYREAARAAREFARAKNLEAGQGGKHPYYAGELF